MALYCEDVLRMSEFQATVYKSCSMYADKTSIRRNSERELFYGDIVHVERPAPTPIEPTSEFLL